MSRIKVLHFISNSAGGSYLRAIADYADRSRFDVRVASLSRRGSLQDDMEERALPTFSLDCDRRTQYLGAAWRLSRYLRREKIHIIQTHLFDACLVGLAAGRLAGTALTVLTDHHSHEILLRGKRLPLWIDCFATRWLSHFIVAPSPHMKEILMDEEGVREDKIAVIPYGFDFKYWSASTGARRRIRAEIGIEDDQILFGAVGRLFWVKDYPSLLKSISAVVKKYPDVTLVVAGDGSDRSRLREMANSLSIGDKVHFLGHRTDIVDVVAAADVVVHASLAECAVQVVAEAFALSKPVVSTEVGGALELIENGVNGYLVPTGDVEALQSAMETMILRRGEWEGMGRQGRKTVGRLAVERVQPAQEAQYLDWLGEMKGSSYAVASS